MGGHRGQKWAQMGTRGRNFATVTYASHVALRVRALSPASFPLFTV